MAKNIYSMMSEKSTSIIEFVLIINGSTRLEGVDIIEWNVASGLLKHGYNLGLSRLLFPFL